MQIFYPHMHFMSFQPKDDGLEHDFMESVIERLASVLVDLKRKHEVES